MTATPHGSFASLTAADGHVLDCWIEPARGTVRGGLVVLQEIFGVTDQLKGVAARYAAQGFKVAVPALFDRQQKGTVIPFDEARRGLDLMQATDPEAVMLDLSAAAEAVRDAGKVGVIGFCWGGGLALRAAQTSGVAAAVSFYGTRLEHLLDRPLKAALQCHFGTRDSHTPPEVVDRLRAMPRRPRSTCMTWATPSPTTIAPPPLTRRRRRWRTSGPPPSWPGTWADP